MQAVANEAGLRIALARLRVIDGIRNRMDDDRGEGVISMAIAILIIASIGLAMYGIFVAIGGDLNDEADRQIQDIIDQ